MKSMKQILPGILKAFRNEEGSVLGPEGSILFLAYHEEDTLKRCLDNIFVN